MKRFVVIFLLTSVFIKGMDRDPRLTIINNYEKKVVVRYEPFLTGLDIANTFLPSSMGVPIQSLPIAAIYTNTPINPGQQVQLKELLTPFVTIIIDGFEKLDNLPIVQPHIPLTINPERNNEIKVTQNTQERAIIIKALQKSQAEPKEKPKVKERSDEDFCCMQ